MAFYVLFGDAFYDVLRESVAFYLPEFVLYEIEVNDTTNLRR